MTNNKLLFTLVLALAVWPGHATAQSPAVERFRLFNECGPMNLVKDHNNNADWTDIGLTEDRIQTMAENRLRAAWLYDATAFPILYVNVNVQGVGFSVRVEYNKVVYDPVSDETAYAITWNVGGAGTHSGDAGFILQGLSEHLDRFILEY